MKTPPPAAQTMPQENPEDIARKEMLWRQIRYRMKHPIIAPPKPKISDACRPAGMVAKDKYGHYDFRESLFREDMLDSYGGVNCSPADKRRLEAIFKNRDEQGSDFYREWVNPTHLEDPGLLPPRSDKGPKDFESPRIEQTSVWFRLANLRRSVIEALRSVAGAIGRVFFRVRFSEKYA